MLSTSEYVSDLEDIKIPHLTRNSRRIDGGVGNALSKIVEVGINAITLSLRQVHIACMHLLQVITRYAY